jgi:hypothetical protein
MKLDEELDTELDGKLNKFEQRLIEGFMGMPTWGILEDNHWTAPHIEPH